VDDSTALQKDKQGNTSLMISPDTQGARECIKTKQSASTLGGGAYIHTVSILIERNEG